MLASFSNQVNCVITSASVATHKPCCKMCIKFLKLLFLFSYYIDAFIFILSNILSTCAILGYIYSRSCKFLKGIFSENKGDISP